MRSLISPPPQEEAKESNPGGKKTILTRNPPTLPPPPLPRYPLPYDEYPLPYDKYLQVALYLSGCDHLMQHFKPVPSWTNVDYVVVGAGTI